MANSIFVWPGMFSFNGSGVVFANPILLPDGTAALPSLAFASAPTFGWFNAGAGVWSYSHAGVAAWAFTGGNLADQGTHQILAGSTTAANAAYAFVGAPGTGMAYVGSELTWSLAGNRAMTLGGANLYSATDGAISLGGAANRFLNAYFLGKILNYNGVNTAGWGVPAIQAAAAPLISQVAAVASVTAYTVGAADGSFDVSANVNVTASATHAFGVVITYTDETNTPRSLTLPMAQLAGTFVASITNVTGAGPYEGATVTVRAKAATAITVTTAGTFTSVTYNVSGTIKQVA